ncbi:MAG: hypothetical protein GY811_21385 [Myxococcales bacterium]|nr:hypothetical protein [Myxococcales bacterium]
MRFEELMMSTTFIAVLAAVALAAIIMVVCLRLVVVGRPDEWVLKIRNGKLVDAGVGIVSVRMPWERIVRFTAAMQRVAFTSSALSSESLPISVEGFVLWSVSPDHDGPFRAFSKLGIVDTRELPDRADRYRKHLLQRPQHKAFQLLVAALVERQVARIPLRSLLSSPDEFVARFREQLIEDVKQMGVVIDDVQLLQIRPTDPDFLRQLSAEIEERTREEAAKRRLGADEEIEQRQVELASKLEQEKIEAERANEVKRARTALKIQEEKAALLEAQFDARRRELDHEHSLRLMEGAQNHAVKLAQEANALVLQGEVTRREDQVHTANLERIRCQAQTEHDTIALLAEVEEAKSDSLRAHELSCLSVERMAEAFGNLPMEQAQWLTVGNQSPVETLASLFTSWRALDANALSSKKTKSPQ